MARRPLWLLLACASLAGCAGPGETNEDVQDTGAAPSTPPPVEVFNETFRWPTLPDDPREWTFEVPAATVNLTVDFNLWLDAPAGYGCCYAVDPLRAYLVSPTGEEITLFSFSAPHPAYHCVNLPDLDPCPLSQPPHLEWTAVPGVWALRLDGIMSADAWLRAVAAA